MLTLGALHFETCANRSNGPSTDQRVRAPSARPRNTSPLFSAILPGIESLALLLGSSAYRSSETNDPSSYPIKRSRFHVHDVHEVHVYFDSIPLSPFVSAETGFEASWYLQRSQSLPKLSPRNRLS